MRGFHATFAQFTTPGLSQTGTPRIIFLARDCIVTMSRIRSDPRFLGSSVNRRDGAFSIRSHSSPEDPRSRSIEAPHQPTRLWRKSGVETMMSGVVARMQQSGPPHGRCFGASWNDGPDFAVALQVIRSFGGFDDRPRLGLLDVEGVHPSFDPQSDPTGDARYQQPFSRDLRDPVATVPWMASAVGRVDHCRHSSAEFLGRARKPLLSSQGALKKTANANNSSGFSV
jgi:hypothetical protein